MKSGICPKCRFKTVYMKKNGIVGESKKIFIRTSLFTAASDKFTYICTNCGYFEDYIEDKTSLKKIREKWQKIN